jgi:hypothetical protein
VLFPVRILHRPLPSLGGASQVGVEFAAAEESPAPMERGKGTTVRFHVNEARKN